MTRAALQVARTIRRRIMVAASELELQALIAAALTTDGFHYEREHRLSGGAIDFYLPASRLGIEVKVDGSPSAVTQQLFRYAEDDSIEALLLVTTRATHLSLGLALRGKRLDVVQVMGGL